jgi:membrane protein CcdC involved in cytochrome C biogenesis
VIWRILSLLSIPVVLWTFWRLAKQVGKPQRVRTIMPVIGMVMSTLMLAVNVFFLHRAAAGLLGAALLVVGIGFGLAWGQSTRFSLKDDVLVAKRSVLYLVFWAGSFAITQLLATFASTVWVTGGLMTMFFSAGATLGTSTNLLARGSLARRAGTEVTS